MACCCISGVEGMDPCDLPIEPEHAEPGRMSQLARRKKVEDGAAEEDDGPLGEELKVGIVSVPGGASQGLELLHSSTSNVVIVASVTQDGPWDEWNQSHPDHMVQCGDQVVEVNGKRGDYTELIAEMTVKAVKSRMMTMVLRRAVESRAVVNKLQGDSFGLTLIPLESGQLFIHAINSGGVIDQWNKEHPNCKIKSLDQILQVGSTTGNAKDLAEAMKQDGDDIELVFLTHR